MHCSCCTLLDDEPQTMAKSAGWNRSRWNDMPTLLYFKRLHSETVKRPTSEKDIPLLPALVGFYALASWRLLSPLYWLLTIITFNFVLASLRFVVWLANWRTSSLFRVFRFVLIQFLHFNANEHVGFWNFENLFEFLSSNTKIFVVDI